MSRTSLRVRRILVAIGDLHHPARSPLRKAATLARSMHASIELFHAITEPVVPHRTRGREEFSAIYMQARERIAQRVQRQLERLAQRPLFRGLRVHAVASWDYPPHEAIIRRALDTKAGLVVAATRAHRFGERFFLTNTDWELVRQCPCPVLLVKSSRDYRQPAVIAAIDPLHAHAKPARLDARILDVGAMFASRLRGTLHAFHAYLPLTFVSPAPVGQPLALTPSPELEELHTQHIAEIFDACAKRASIPSARRHLHMGEVLSELESVVRRTKAGIVVMGAVSRSGLRRVFIGNTAEAVLDRLSCDLLVIKPRAFATHVPKRVRVIGATA
jgi:universal stress protein E